MNSSKTISLLLFLVYFLAAHVSAENFLSKNSNAFAEPEFLPVDQAFVFNQIAVDDGIVVSWQIAPEYYLYKDRIKIEADNPSIALGEPAFSQIGEQKDDPNFGMVTVFHDLVEMSVPVIMGNPTQEGIFELMITYQGCAEAGLCYPPQKRKIAFMSAAEPLTNTKTLAQPSTQQLDTQSQTETTAANSPETDLASSSGIFNLLNQASFGSIVFTFFLLGLGLTFTPCVLPMIPIITTVISGQKHRSSRNSLLLSISYVCGMAITYAAAGVLTGLLGATANLQAQMQAPGVLIVLSALFALLSLSMFGLYELQLPRFITDRLNDQSQKISGGKLGSVFLIGALSALIVSPCVSAPLAGALVYISTTEDALLGGISLLALGFGMGVPLILIALGGDKFLPKAGRWMEATKKFFGFLLLALAIWLLDRLLPTNVSMLLWGLLFAQSAVHLGAFSKAESGWAMTFKAFTLLLFFYAALLTISALANFFPTLHSANILPSGLSISSAAQSHAPFKRITTLDELKTELAASQNSKKVMMLDYYADWCISCKVMEREVFSSPEIAAELNNLHLVQADVTDVNEQTTALLEQFNLFGPPSILFFDSNGNELTKLRIQGEVGKTSFEKTLQKIKQHYSNK